MRSQAMHELAICYGLLDELQAVANDRSASRVCSVVLSIGPLAGVEPAALQQAFSVAAAGTVAEGAELIIDTKRVRLRCDQCGAESEAPHIGHLTCGSCGSWRTSVLEGAELQLTRVELETPTDNVGETPAQAPRETHRAH